MFEFSMDKHSNKNIHFIGIGGISMSGLAEILLSKGYNVTGSDSSNGPIIERLKNLGAIVSIGHNKENINDADLIIYTDAISSDNEELIAALNCGCTVVDRATFLGALMKNFTNSIAVSGTHGKTTTTSMIATITNHANINPTILLGGQLDDIGGNVRLGNSNLIITEACEYKANILKYFPTMAIILNIDEDHLDYFKSMEHIQDTFIGYGKNLNENNYLVINIDDLSAGKVIENTKAKVVSIGIENNCDYRAEDVVFSSEGFPTFTLNIRNKEFHKITLSVMGIHNIYNSLAAIASTHSFGIPMDVIKQYITYYNGVHRRLELKGYINNVKVFDDYAHHPTEIRATLTALKNTAKGRVICIFQPHTFTRTKILLETFSESFRYADKVVIADIYAARERDNGEIHSRDLANAVRLKGSDVVYLSTFAEIEDYLLKEARDNDIVITMGAGNVYQIGEAILEKSKKEAVWRTVHNWKD